MEYTLCNRSTPSVSCRISKRCASLKSTPVAIASASTPDCLISLTKLTRSGVEVPLRYCHDSTAFCTLRCKARVVLAWLVFSFTTSTVPCKTSFGSNQRFKILTRLRAWKRKMTLFASAKTGFPTTHSKAIG